MNWIRRIVATFRSKARHVERLPAKAAQDRAGAAVQEAQNRRIKADAVVSSLERRVFQENHISEGIARLWVGRP